VLTAVATGMTAYLQFGTLLPMLSVAGGSLVIATFVGIFVTTWMTGRIAKMNAAAVFISLLFWAWLWGVWGMLLSIPIIALTVREDSLEKRDSGAVTLAKTTTTKQVGKRDVEGVFVVGTDNKVTFKPVKVGIAGEKYFEVVTGLKEKEKIVGGTYQAIRELKDGSRVKSAVADDKKKGEAKKS